jgi:hypothetical protein
MGTKSYQPAQTEVATYSLEATDVSYGSPRLLTDRCQNGPGAIFISMELSRTNWLLTSLPPGGGERVLKHVLRSGDVAGLRTRFSQIRERVRARMGRTAVPIIVVQEAGRDGFWM